MVSSQFDVAMECQRLSQAADRWKSIAPVDRAELAKKTAQSVGEEAEAWIRAAVVMKSVNPDGEVVCSNELRTILRAEECATGPIATLRLLILTEQALRSIGQLGVTNVSVKPRVTHVQEQNSEASYSTSSSLLSVDVLPVRSLYDPTIFRGHQATVRCTNSGSVETFMKLWKEECQRRPHSSGVAVVLGAGNVTGLAAADAVSQIFEYGRAVLLKIHPVQSSLALSLIHI